MAATGAGLVDGLREAARQAVQIERVFEPSVEREPYDELYAIYRDTYLALKPAHAALAKLRRQPDIVPTS